MANETAREQPPKRRSVFESPWYWLYVFAAGGLAALIIMGPRYGDRQSQIERNFQGRERANQRAMGEEISGEISTPEDTVISLTPLFIAGGIVFLISWTALWWTQFRPRSVSQSPSVRSTRTLSEDPAS